MKCATCKNARGDIRCTTLHKHMLSPSLPAPCAGPAFSPLELPLDVPAARAWGELLPRPLPGKGNALQHT
eukprot:6330826-Lingulodinium_polyedra.AAC.1